MREKNIYYFSKEKILKWMYKRFSLILILLIISCISAWSQTPGVNYFISPASIDNIEVGEEFTIRVQADFVNGGALNAAEIHLGYNPEYLEVINLVANSSLTTTSKLQYNNSIGEVEYLGGIENTTVSTDFDILTITFRANGISPTGNTSLIFPYCSSS